MVNARIRAGAYIFVGLRRLGNIAGVLDIYKIGKQMEKIHKKVVLLRKKQSVFGLTAEEEEKLHYYLAESWVLHEEMIETHIKITVIPFLLDKESSNILDDIKKILPWDGSLIRKEEDYEKITNKAVELTVLEREYISNKLINLHKNVMQNFESFCSTEEGYIYMQEVSKIISKEEDGNVLDVLIYLDARYRELAELLDIHLEEVEIIWEEDDDERDI